MSLTLKQFREQTAGKPDDTVIVLDGHNRAFRHCTVRTTSAVMASSGLLFDDDASKLVPGDRRVDVVVIR